MPHPSIGFCVIALWGAAPFWLRRRRSWKEFRGAPGHALAALPQTARPVHPERVGGGHGLLDLTAWASIVVGVSVLGFAA